MAMSVYLADQFHAALVEELQVKSYMYVEGKPVLHPISNAGLIDCNVLVISTKSNITAAVLDSLPHLKVIIRGGSGMDNIDTSYAQKKGIVCLNTPEANRDSVAEHALGMMIALLHNFKSQREIEMGIWQPYTNRPTELKQKTVAIIGYGNTGMALARLLKPFNCRVLAYDKYKTNYADDFVVESSWAAIYKEADIVSLHVPLTAETHGLISVKNYADFSKKIMLINTGRGEVVETNAIIAALETGIWAGAALDVVEDEQHFLSSALYRFIHANQMSDRSPLPLLITPHIAGKSYESHRRIAIEVIKKLTEYEGFILSN